MDKRKMWLRGSFTVEASFIVPFCFLAILTVIWFCFYLSNAAIATGVIEKNLAKLTYQGGEMETKVGKVKAEIRADLDKALVAVTGYDLDCRARKDMITVTFKGRMYNPVGIVKDMELSVSENVKRPMPVEFIRNVRRIKGLYDK